MSTASRARHAKRPNTTKRHKPNRYGYETTETDAHGFVVSRINWPEGYKLDGTTIKRDKQEAK